MRGLSINLIIGFFVLSLFSLNVQPTGHMEDVRQYDLTSTTSSLTSTTLSCGETVFGDTLLSNDLFNCPGEGLVIGGHNITLDCAGHTIDGSEETREVGVTIKNKSNVRIINCTIQEFEEAVRVEKSEEIVIESNQIINNSESIIQSNTLSSIIVNNRFIDNWDGIEVYNNPTKITRTNISYNYFENSDDGIVIDSGQFVSITENMIISGDVGISAQNLGHSIEVGENSVKKISNGNPSIVGNSILNHDTGVILESSENVAVLQNIIFNIYEQGISLRWASNNTVTENQIKNSDIHGIFLIHSHDNQVKENSIQKSKYGIRAGSSNKNQFIENELFNITYSIMLGDYGSFADDSGSDIYMSYSTNNIFEQNNFFDYNLSIVNLQPVDVNAKNNYWNTEECPVIEDSIIDKHDNPSFGQVYYSPFFSDIRTYNTKTCERPPVEYLDYTCGMNISNDTVLTNDVTNCLEYGLVINSDNLTLDCAGHEITEYEIFGGATTGVSIEARKGVKIINCSIIGFSDGIFIRESEDVLVSSNNLEHNEQGIYLSAAQGVKIEKNTIVGNSGTGIEIRNGEKSDIYKNNISGNSRDGIGTSSMSNSRIYENQIAFNRRGMDLGNLDNVGIFRNIISDSETNGINFRNIINLSFYNNSIINNHRPGHWIVSTKDTINARFNWWDTQSCETISDNILGDIQYEPFLNSPFPQGIPTDCSGNIITTTTSTTTTTSSTTTSTSPSTTTTTILPPAKVVAGGNDRMLNYAKPKKKIETSTTSVISTTSIVATSTIVTTTIRATTTSTNKATTSTAGPTTTTTIQKTTHQGMPTGFIPAQPENEGDSLKFSIIILIAVLPLIIGLKRILH